MVISVTVSKVSVDPYSNESSPEDKTVPGLSCFRTGTSYVPLIRGPSVTERRWQQHHGSVHTNAGDFSVQNDADREQEVPVVQLQVRAGVRTDRTAASFGPDSLSAAGKMLM